MVLWCNEGLRSLAIAAGRHYQDRGCQEALPPLPPMATLFTVAHSSVRCWIRALDSIADCHVSAAESHCRRTSSRSASSARSKQCSSSSLSDSRFMTDIAALMHRGSVGAGAPALSEGGAHRP
jgi:hypothetical protein